MSADNIILDTDSYKASHWLQFPSDPWPTNAMYYLESRGGEYDETCFFGLQYILERYFAGKVVHEHDVDEARDFFAAHGLPFNYDGWLRIARDLNGYLPIEIRAVQEGMVVPNRNVLMTVTATDPESFWVVSWLETALMRMWYPITVATTSRYVRKTLERYHELTSDDDPAGLLFKLHDFGSRGVSSRESAEIGGAAHLVNFLGSDTVAAVVAANEYYDHPMSAFSIPAAEHSTITAWGRDGEADAYRNMLERFAGDGALLAVVSDSYDLYSAIDNIWGDELKEAVVDNGGTVIIRPDSGDPDVVVLETLRRLGAAFGTTTNSKGFKVLPPYVRVIQGDGVNPASIKGILAVMKDHGWSVDNIAFGMGGALLQHVNRDTQQFAFKMCALERDGEWVPISKDPATDPGKASKGGLLDLIKKPDGKYATIDRAQDTEGARANWPSQLGVVFRDGTILRHTTLDEVRERAWPTS